MKLSEYAEQHSITYRAAWNRFKAGKIPNAYKDDTGHILVGKKPSNETKVAIYTRVSSNENKANLDAQAARLTKYATAKGYQIIHVVKEVASGVNDKRKKLNKLLTQEDWNILLVEHKDRLARLGTGYIEFFLDQQGKRLEIVNMAENDTSDLVQDLVSIIYSFSAKLYGLRRSKRRTEKIISYLEDIKNDKQKRQEKQKR